MPPRSTPATITRTVVKPAKFELTNYIGTGIISLLLGLIGTGIVSMVSLHTQQATLTEQVRSTSAALAKHLDHSVDRDEYIRRDQEIQHAIEGMATKEELREMRRSIDGQTQTLRDLEAAITARSRR